MSEHSVTVITGGAGGMAGSFAKRMSAENRFVLADVSASRLEDAARRLTSDGREVHTAVCEVRDKESVRALAELASSLGRIGQVVHTAGVAPPTAKDPRTILDIDLVGTANILDAFEPLAVDHTVGICVASLGGHRQFTRRFDDLLADPAAPSFLDQATEIASKFEQAALAAYGLAKRGVILQCERRAASWGARGARLLSISPGLIADTSMGEAAATIHAGAYAHQAAVGRAGSADDVAGLMSFLCSEDAAYLSGCDILVDGGVLGHINWHGEQAACHAWHELS